MGEALQIRLEMAKHRFRQEVDRCTSLAFVVLRAKKRIAKLKQQRKALEQAREVIEADDYEENLTEGTNPSNIDESLSIAGVGNARAAQARSYDVRLEGIKEYHPGSSNPQDVLDRVNRLRGDDKVKKKQRTKFSPSGQTCDDVKMCSSHGECLWDSLSNTFYCECEKKYFGESCNEARCPKNCSGNGDCIKGTCMCNPDFCGSGWEKACRSNAAKRLYQIADLF